MLEIRELYSWANIYKTNFFYRVDNSIIQKGSRKIGFELIITNYDVNEGPVQYELALETDGKVFFFKRTL